MRNAEGNPSLSDAEGNPSLSDTARALRGRYVLVTVPHQRQRRARFIARREREDPATRRGSNAFGQNGAARQPGRNAGQEASAEPGSPARRLGTRRAVPV